MGYSNWILPKVALSGSFSKLGRPTFKEGIDEKPGPYRRRYEEKIKVHV